MATTERKQNRSPRIIAYGIIAIVLAIVVAVTADESHRVDIIVGLVICGVGATWLLYELFSGRVLYSYRLFDKYVAHFPQWVYVDEHPGFYWIILSLHTAILAFLCIRLLC